MKAIICVYDKSLMFNLEDIKYNFLKTDLEIFPKALTKEKIKELKTKKFNKKEDEVLSFLDAYVVLVDNDVSIVYLGDIVFDEENSGVILKNYKSKELVNLACFNFVTRINL